MKHFKKASRVNGLYYYCISCGRQIDFYEQVKQDGKCIYCYYC